MGGFRYEKRIINKSVAKKVAKDFGYKEVEVNKILEAFSNTLRVHIETMDLRPFHISYFGKIKVKPFRLFALNNKETIARRRRYGLPLMKDIPFVTELGNGYIRVEYKREVAILHQDTLSEFIKSIKEKNEQITNS